MANAQRDENRITAMTAVSNADGTTILGVYANPTNNAVKVSDGSTGTAGTRTNAAIDDNHVPTLTALSSAGDGVIVPLAVDSLTNYLLIQST